MPALPIMNRDRNLSAGTHGSNERLYTARPHGRHVGQRHQNRPLITQCTDAGSDTGTEAALGRGGDQYAAAECSQTL